MMNLHQSVLGALGNRGGVVSSFLRFGFKATPQVAGMSSRDNHNGNARGGRPNYYLWKPPPYGQNLPAMDTERA